MARLRLWRRPSHRDDDAPLSGADADVIPQAAALEALERSVERARGEAERESEEPSPRPLPDLSDGEALRIACVSGKGGVGKTTTTISLAAAFGELGLSTLAIDCDPQSNLTSGLGLDELDPAPLTIADVLTGRAAAGDAVVPTRWKGVWVIPASPDLSAVEASIPSARGRQVLLRDALRRSDVSRRFSAVLFDSPPNFAFHTVNVLAATRYVLVPLAMSGFAVRGLKEVLRVVRAAREELNADLELLGLVPTFVNLRTRMSRDMITAICEVSGIRVFESRIPETVKVQESSLLGRPITVHARRSAAAEAYRRLAADILAAVQPAADDRLPGAGSPLWLSNP